MFLCSSQHFFQTLETELLAKTESFLFSQAIGYILQRTSCCWCCFSFRRDVQTEGRLLGKQLMMMMMMWPVAFGDLVMQRPTPWFGTTPGPTPWFGSISGPIPWFGCYHSCLSLIIWLMPTLDVDVLWMSRAATREIPSTPLQVTIHTTRKCYCVVIYLFTDL